LSPAASRFGDTAGPDRFGIKGGGVLPGVDLDDSSALLDLMET